MTRAVTEVSTIPWEECWLDAHGVAQLTGFSKRYVGEKLVHHATFPQATRVGKGMRMWKAGEIAAWMELHREKRTGRPRKALE